MQGKKKCKKLDEDMAKMRARFQALSEKSKGCKRSGRGDSDPVSWRGSCEEVARRSPWDPTMLEQFFAFGETHAASFVHDAQQEFARQYRSSDVPEQEARAEEKEAWEEHGDDERMANGRYEGAAFGSAVDPAEGSDAIGGSFGGGHPSTPRNGARARDSSRSPRGK